MSSEYKPGIKYGPNNRPGIDWDRYQAGTGGSLDFSQGGIQGNVAKDAGWWNPWDMDLQYDENGRPFFEGSFGGAREYIDEQYFKDNPESGSIGKETSRKEAFNAQEAVKKAGKFKVDPNEMSDWGKIGYMAAPALSKGANAIGKGIVGGTKALVGGAGAVLGGTGAVLGGAYGGLKKGVGTAYDALSEAWQNHTGRDDNNAPLPAKRSRLLRANDEVYQNMSEEEQIQYDKVFGRGMSDEEKKNNTRLYGARNVNASIKPTTRSSTALPSIYTGTPPVNVMSQSKTSAMFQGGPKQVAERMARNPEFAAGMAEHYPDFEYNIPDPSNNNQSALWQGPNAAPNAAPNIDPNWEPTITQTPQQVKAARTPTQTDQQLYEEHLAQQKRIEARQANSTTNTEQQDAIDAANAQDPNELAKTLIGINPIHEPNSPQVVAEQEAELKTEHKRNLFNDAYSNWQEDGKYAAIPDELVKQLGRKTYDEYKSGLITDRMMKDILKGWKDKNDKASNPFPLQKAGQNLNWWGKLKSKI